MSPRATAGLPAARLSHSPGARAFPGELCALGSLPAAVLSIANGYRHTGGQQYTFILYYIEDFRVHEKDALHQSCTNKNTPSVGQSYTSTPAVIFSTIVQVKLYLRYYAM